jgi:hypothetical protein
MLAVMSGVRNITLKGSGEEEAALFYKWPGVRANWGTSVARLADSSDNDFHCHKGQPMRESLS